MNAALNSYLRTNTGFEFFKIKIFCHQSNYLHGRKFYIYIHIYKRTSNCDFFKFLLERVTNAIARNCAAYRAEETFSLGNNNTTV